MSQALRSTINPKELPKIHKNLKRLDKVDQLALEVVERVALISQTVLLALIESLRPPLNQKKRLVITENQQLKRYQQKFTLQEILESMSLRHRT